MRICLRCGFCAIFVSCFLRGASCLKVNIASYPSRAARESPAFVRCSPEPREAITGCQFRLWYVGRQQEGVLLNVTRADNKVKIPNPYHNDTSFTAQLFGSHFDHGYCDVRLEKVKGDHLVVGCKLTTESHRSDVETTPIFFTDNAPLRLVKHEATHLARDGQTVDVWLQTEDRVGLRNCTATLPNHAKLKVYPGILPGTSNVVARHKDDSYYIDPKYTPTEGLLAKGECGFNIHKVTERDNGVFFVLGYGEDGKSVSAKAVTLIVTPTESPSINMTFLEDREDFDVGDNLTVTCKASGVPRPSVEWRWGWNSTTYDAEPLRLRQLGDVIEGWSWPWQDAVFSQSVTFTLRQEHHGKMIRCSVGVVKKPIILATQSKLIKMKHATENASTGNRGSSSGQPPALSTTSTTTKLPKPPPPSKNTKIATRTVETVGTHTKTALGERTTQNKTYQIAGVVVALLAVAIICSVGLCAFFKVACFKVYKIPRGRMSIREPSYDEINEALALQLASPPALPARPMTRNTLRNVQLAVPEEFAPKRPPSPDYIMPEPPDDWLKLAPPTAQPTQLAVPKFAPKRPPSPDYIIPEPPDDSVNADGYMKPTFKC